MTNDDAPQFAQLMHGLGEVFGEPVSAMRVELYFRALEDLPLLDIRRAAGVHTKHGKFFPRPAELREAIQGSLEDRAELAWAAVVAQVRSVGYTGTPHWPDDAARRGVNDVFGGWKSLCRRLPAEGLELQGWAKQFKATYRAYSLCERAKTLSPPNPHLALKP